MEEPGRSSLHHEIAALILEDGAEGEADSSKWIKPTLGRSAFAWQEGYGAFTVGAPGLEKLREYVLNQEEPHREESFQTEYVKMLRQGVVEFDDRYLW